MNKLILIFLALVALQSAYAQVFQSVRLEDIKWIDLYRGRYTTGYKPIEQQQCFDSGERLCSYYRPDYVKCFNRGFRSGQVIWECGAKLSNGIAFGATDVSCETYPGTKPYQGIVILGSCGLRYNLRRR